MRHFSDTAADVLNAVGSNGKKQGLLSTENARAVDGTEDGCPAPTG